MDFKFKGINSKNEFTVKVGEAIERIKISINTGTTIEDQFADFF